LVFNHRILAPRIFDVSVCEVPIAARLRFSQSRQKREVGFGRMPLQRTPATRRCEQASGKLSDGHAFKPARWKRALPRFPLKSQTLKLTTGSRLVLFVFEQDAANFRLVICISAPPSHSTATLAALPAMSAHPIRSIPIAELERLDDSLGIHSSSSLGF
jgi:hypothetical protein